MSSGLVVGGGALWDGADGFWADGLVEIASGAVAYCGPASGYEKTPGRDEPPRLDAGGGLIMPGLVNAHCHAPMTLFRGLADDLPLEDWLHKHMFPAEAEHVNEDMTEACALLAAAEMLLSGTTCVGDSYFCAHGSARAFERAGMRALAAQGVIDFPAPGVPDPGRGVDAAREFVRHWKNRSPLITPAVFAHSTYTCSPATLEKIAAMAEEEGVIWQTHLCETKAEVELVKSMYSASPARHLENLGLLQGLGAAVHGVWLDRGEMELLARRDVKLAHCPESNHKLGSGRGDSDAWLGAGITVGLGTDGAASNNDLDLFSEMASAALAAKLKRMEPQALPARAVLGMALSGGAACLVLEGVAGGLAPGHAGDLIVLDMEQPHLTPMYDIASHLVYAARGADVRHTVVAGRVLVQDRELAGLDLEGIMARVRELAGRVRG